MAKTASSAKLKRNKREALKYANLWRGAIGLPPVRSLAKGERHNAFGDAFANTIRAGAEKYWRPVVSLFDTGLKDSRFATLVEYVPNPERVKEFILDFDRGRYPELLQK